jgi:ABC-2 type transport system ATP-binding protein
MITGQELRKGFDSGPAVRDISFDGLGGAIRGLVGANGAGKATTLRVICGVLKPKSGSSVIDGVADKGDPSVTAGPSATLVHLPGS